MPVSSTQFSSGEMEELMAFLSAAGFHRPSHIETIVQEASHRSYFRILLGPGDPGSLVLCRDLPIPDPDSFDSLRINRYLHDHGIPVPRILRVEPASGWILQSDGGRSDVSETLRSPGFEPGTRERVNLIESVLALLSEIHGLPPAAPVSLRFFDREKLWWEMEFLLTRWKEAWALLAPDATDTPAIPGGFIEYLEQTVQTLARGNPMVYTHRDFHGRNILVDTAPGPSEPHLTLVDYQDARMGLPWYDLASFLYDPYSSLLPEEREQFYRNYCERNGYHPEESYPLFRKQAIQRLLKALGSFLFFVYQKRMHKYVPSIPAALDLLWTLATPETDGPLREFIHGIRQMLPASAPTPERETGVAEVSLPQTTPGDSSVESQMEGESQRG